MKMATLALSFLLVSQFALVANGVQKRKPVAASPDGVVRELYRVHRNGYGRVFEKRGRKNQQNFFDKNLAGLIWKDLTETPADMVGNLDFDPLYNAQDTHITRLRIGSPVVDGEKVSVPVSFNNYGKPNNIKFMMVNEGGVWKIANIDYGDDFNLVKILSAPVN